MRYIPLLLLVVLTACGPGSSGPANVEQLNRLAAQYVDQWRPGAPRVDRTEYSALAFEQEIASQKQTLQELLA
ncbi:MAG: hypothetical protein OES53_13115, partial [Xanthomonadales bacterium]|nr:hypothetical protein [Xanthomonadales bacterium]